MKTTAIVLDVIAFLFGVVAAWFWWKASRVTVSDPYPQDGASRGTEMGDFVMPTIRAFEQNARWNKIAAILTGISVLFGALGNLASLLAPCPHQSN